ncbi:unnamed protein product, partial [Choristocarpus tenellus]
PKIWKAFAREVLTNVELQTGFLSLVAHIESMTDYRSQELSFEAVYRLWKVWRKLPGGPPTIPDGCNEEVAQSLSSIQVAGFDEEVRHMLNRLN